MENYSVLMSVYYKENPQYLQESIMSILNQTVKTNDFVIVCDGNLTKELDDVVKHYETKYPEVFNIIRLPENIGQGNALNVGLSKCKNNLVARMDSDDISFTNRCEIQINHFKHGVDIVSASVKEFLNDINNVTTTRVLPETHGEIMKFAKRRNPFNHPCVMFRKEAVLKAGNYKDFYLYEDYFLWIRMLQSGAKGYNIKDSLLYMRAGNEMYKRRGGNKYFISSVRFQKYLLDNKFISLGRYYYNILLRFLGQVIIPDSIRGNIFKIFMRKNY